MQNNDLEEKLKKVIFNIFTFLFWYLVISFFLKSDYPLYENSFDTKVAYEILRDGLTLSAYFLAPAIAYVLFTDWRVQHKAIKADNFYDDLDLRVKEAYHIANNMFLDITTRTKKSDFLEKITNNTADLFTSIEQIRLRSIVFKHEHNQQGQEFMEHIKEILKLFANIHFQFLIVGIDLSRLTDNNIDEVRAAKATINLNIQRLENNLDKIQDKLSKLTDFKPSL